MFVLACKTLNRGQLGTKSSSKDIVATLFQASSTCSQERRVTDDFSPHYGTLQVGLWASEILCHFPSKISFVFRSKTFPTNVSLTQKRSNVQHNNGEES